MAIPVTKSERFDVRTVVAAVQRAVGTPNGTLGLHEPVFGGNELTYLEQCIKSTFVSSVGKFVDRFEHMLEEFTGAKRASRLRQWHRGAARLLQACWRGTGRRGDFAGAAIQRDNQRDYLLRRDAALR